MSTVSFGRNQRAKPLQKDKTRYYTKKKLLLLVFAVILVVVEGQSPSGKVIGYHTQFGVPQAERIRRREAIRSRIVGGMVSYAGENPFLAGLIIDLTNGQTSICGGTLLNRRKVLTAGQCWYDGNLQGENITVVLGSTEIFSGGERQRAYSVIAHPRFDPFKLVNDLAMLTIRGVSYSNYIQPASLPVYEVYSLDGVTAKVVGYGVTSDSTYGEFSPSQIQYTAYVPVIANEECDAAYNGTIDDNAVCTSGTNRWGPCIGDSGAPLVYNTYPGENMLIGVASFHASTGCQSGYPFGYMRVSAYIDWIQNLMY